ncbi:MAG: hypothetical protein HQM11_10905 [SAR324 cluster bacterium]|nr:hypothetical protein [SAR324 cluster bacterium]
MKHTLISLFTLIMLFVLSSDCLAIERRREQIQTDFGYIVTPMPFILPGVGTGFGLLGGLNNIYETPVDLFLVFIAGDVEGAILGTTDIPLVPNHWLLDLTTVRFNKGQQNRYLQRGMDSESDEFNIVELDDSALQGFRSILTFYDRMLEFYAISYNIQFKLSAIRDNEGNLQNKIENPEEINFKSGTYGFLLDYTDDRIDPKQGVRLSVERSATPPQNSDSVNYYVMNYSLTGLVPMLDYSTWAFHYFRSDSVVENKGETDLLALSQDYGCYETDFDLCNESIKGVVQDQVAQNTYGSATSLGGRARLRAYSEGRFSAAHTEFIATEFRWNLTNENTPFDIGIMKDLRTGIQLAFFYEMGTVAETTPDLWKKYKYSVGSGARLVTGSGFVYRFDLGFGDEGVATTLFVDYPWGAL